MCAELGVTGMTVQPVCPAATGKSVTRDFLSKEARKTI